MTATAEDGSVEGIAWDLSDEYPAADAPEVERDLERLDALQDELEAGQPGPGAAARSGGDAGTGGCGGRHRRGAAGLRAGGGGDAAC